MEDNKLKELHDLLVSIGIDNKSFDEFQSNFSNDTDKQRKLHDILVSRGVDNKSFNEFQGNFFLKKKEELQPTSQEEDTGYITLDVEEDGSLVSSDQTSKPSLVNIKGPSEEQMEGMRRALGGVSNEDIDSDKNIQAAINSGYISPDDLYAAGYSKPDEISTIKTQPSEAEKEQAKRKISVIKTKTAEDIDFFISEKKLNTPYAYEDNSDLTTQKTEGDLKRLDAIQAVASFDNETNKLIKENPNLTKEELKLREGRPTDEQYELAENYNTGFDGTDVDRMYSSKKLENISGFNVKDFDGYINSQGYKEEYLRLLEQETISEDGRDYDYSGNYNPALAAESLKLKFLTNYVNNQLERNLEFQKLDYQKKTGIDPSFDNATFSINSGIDDKALTEYIEDSFPLITSKLKDRDIKNQELYQEMKKGEIKGGSQAFKQGWRSLSDRINSFSAGTYDFFGAENIADEIRMNQAESELSREDFMRYTYASGKEVIDSEDTNYVVDDKGQIYDTDLGLRVTDVLTPSKVKEVYSKAGKSEKESSTFSTSGMLIEGTGIASDMLFQIAIQRGLTVAGAAGRGALLSNLGLTATAGNSASLVNLMSQVPMKATTASSMIAQGTLFSTNLSEQAYTQALDNGMSISQAKEIKSIAGSQGLALGIITAPLSTQTYAMDKIFGKNADDILLKGALEAYEQAGAKGAKAYWMKAGLKASEYLKEGGKEVFQENVQQAGENYVINKNINEFAKKEIMADTISGDQFINTTILSSFAGVLMPFAGSLTSKAKTSFNKKYRPGVSAIDKMNALSALSKDVDKTTSLLNSQVKIGLYTEDQVASILADVDVYRNTVNSLPKNLSADTALNVMRDINEIKKQQQLKNELDPAFHKGIDDKINEIRTEIIKKTNFDFISKKAQQKLKEDATIELTKEAQERGEQDFELNNSQITFRAIENFSNLTEEEKTIVEEQAESKTTTKKQVTRDDAIKSLKEAARLETENTGVGVLPDLSEESISDRIKLLSEEQETRDIPDAERAEGVQEMEVQEPAVEEKRKEIEQRRLVELFNAPDEMLIAPMISNGKGGFIANPEVAKAIKVKEKINAKYDAELADLEQQTTQATTEAKQEKGKLDNKTYTTNEGEVFGIDIYDAENGKVENIEDRKREDRLSMNMVDKNGKTVGTIGLWKKDDGTWFANLVDVKEEHRRKGIATALYDYAESKGFKTVDSDKQTDAGKAFKDARNKRKTNEKTPSNNIKPNADVQPKDVNYVTPETSSNYANMTEDGEGNFVFYHRGDKGYEKIQPRSGDTRATSTPERLAISKVGGLAMFYTRVEDGESAVTGDAKYEVKVPIEKVYDFNLDPLNFYEEGKKRHDKEHPGKAYDKNTSLAYVTKIAGENGFDMVVSEWGKRTRAQTTKSIAPVDVQERTGNTINKKFKNKYESNTSKGFVPVIPETKNQKLYSLYEKIREERNKEARYDKMYFLSEKEENYTQDEITNLINESDISDKLKDEYNNILNAKQEARKSINTKTEKNYTSNEIDKLKSLPIESYGGATMNLDGSKYENGGLVVPVTSINIKVSELTAEAIDNLIKENSESIGSDNVKFGIYKFPNSDNASIDINIVADRSMRSEALKIGKELGQESLFDLDTFENIKTGADGKNPKKLTPKEFLEIQEKLKPKEDTKTTTEAQKIKEIMSVDVSSQVEDAKKALSKVAPDVEIILHESEQAYAEATGETGRKQKTAGSYSETVVDGEKKKVIHINPEKANERTVAHEVFHAIFLNSIKNDAEAQRLSAAMIKAVYKTAPAELKRIIDDFATSKNSDGSNNYDLAIQNEEKLAELVGYLAAEYDSLQKPTKNVIKRWLDRLAKMFGMKPFTDSEVIDVLNTIAKKVSTGEAITVDDIVIFNKQGSQGSVGVFKIARNQRQSPNPKNDSRPWVRELVDVVKIKDLEGEKFITNMYDFTTAGEVDLAEGLKMELLGGRNYVPYMMNKTGKKMGDVSNLAAFNSKSAAEGFVNSSKQSGAKLFAPHIGTIEGSWQFQHHIFKSLVDIVLDNKLIPKSTLIKEWNDVIKSKAGKELIDQFNSRNATNIRTFDKFSSNPKELVDLLDIENNFSPKLRKALNDKLVGIKSLKEKLDLKNKMQILSKMIDPLNKGAESFDIMSIVEFDPNTFEIVKTKSTDPDHHPSFGWTVKSKINKVLQPDYFYKSYDITDSYTKYNLDGTTVSKKTDFKDIKDFSSSNVSSSAGAIPKVAEFKPTTKSSKQQIRIEDIISKLKSNGISDASVIKYLEEQGFENGAKEVAKYNKANDVSIDLFRELPPAFKSTENGLNLAKRVVAHTEKLASRLGIDEAINKGIEFLQSQPEYKKLIKEDNDYILSDALVREFEAMMEKKVKRSPSAEKILGMRAEDKKIRADIRRTLKLRGKGANDLQRLKVQVRNFVKKNIPRGDYTKGEISRILSIVTNVKDINSLDKAMDQVTEFVEAKKSKNLRDYIDKVLSKKYSVTNSGILVAKTIGAEAKKAIDYINSNKSIDDAYSLIEEIESKDSLTEEDLNQIVAAEASIAFLSYDADNENQLDNLEVLKNNLDAIIAEGKSELKAQKKADHERYVQNKKDAFKDITGVDYDSTTKESRAAFKFNEEQKKARQGRIKKAYTSLFEKINSFFVKQEALRGMVDIISKGTGEMFGGKLQEMVTDKVNDSSFLYKENILKMKAALQDKVKEIYGEKWIKSIRDNRETVDTGYKLSSGENLFMSQDEAAYLYNQYKDPLNHSNFESKFVGENVPEMMEFIEKNFLSKESKEFSDWMVGELFPSLYGRYNEVYKRMNRIDMPWNSKYAGKLYNVTNKNIEVTDILTGTNNVRASLTNGSQKERIDNNNPIQVVNQMDMLFSYLKDMEFYVAYAENLRDIQKIFNDKDIGDAIEQTSGKDVLSSVRMKINTVVNRGLNVNQKAAKLVNAMTDVFITSRLGLNPTVGIKQLTSSIAYSSEIGIEKWIAEIPQGVMSFKKTWEEIVENSPYIRDRYDKSINQSFEIYSESSLSKFVPKSSTNKGMDALMWFIKVGDKGGIMGGIPNYLYHKKQFKKKNPKATEQQAIDYAIKKFQNVTKDTQQSNDIQDRDLFQDDPNYRWLSLFQTSQKQYLRKEFSSIRQIIRKSRGLKSKGSLRSNIETFLMYHTVLPVFFQYIALGLPGILSDWDDDDDETLARAAIVGNLNAIFIFGDVIESISNLIEKKPWAGDTTSLPILQSVSAIIKNSMKWSNSKKPETVDKWRSKTILETLSLTGLPASNMNRIYNNLDALINKEESKRKKALRILQFSDYVIEGDKKPTKKKRFIFKKEGN